MALQHLRSSTAHKRPIPTVMSAGQIAINTNEASPALFFKDSNGDLVKVGPVHIGTDAPNSSPASVAATALVTGTVYQILTVGDSDFTLVGAASNTVGTIFTATGTTTGTGTVSGQQGNEKGEQWLDTTGGAYDLKIYDGTSWRSQAGEFVNVTGDTMTGALLLDNAASASAPDLSFDGDADTGVYSPGADQVAIATGGNGRVFIDSTGRLGVGIASPSRILHVDSGAVNNSYARFTNTNSTDNGAEVGLFDSGSAGPALVLNNSMSDGLIVFYTDSTERARIDSSGRLGLGTSTPSSYFNGANNLVVGDATAETGITIAGGSSTNSNIYFADGTSGSAAYAGILRYTHLNDSFSLWTAGQRRIDIDSSGRLLVGTSTSTGNVELNENITSVIKGSAAVWNASFVGYSGTTSPSFRGPGLIFKRSRGETDGSFTSVASGDLLARLDFYGADGSAFIPAAQISAQVDGTPGANDMPGRLVFSTTADGASSPTERMRIDSSGNVGIGTTSPSAKLHATGEIRYGSNTTYYGTIDHDAASTGANIYNSVDSGGHIFKRNNTIEQMRIDSSGNVEVKNGSELRVYRSDNTRYGRFYTDGFATILEANPSPADPLRLASAERLEFYTGSNERMRIDSSGNVGIGTTSPYANLQVGNYSGSTGISIGGVSNGYSYLYLADGSSGNALYRGYLQYYHVDDSLQIGTSGTERIRIDGAGRLLVNRSATAANGALAQFSSSVGPHISVNNTGASSAFMLFQNSTSGDGPGGGLYVGNDGSGNGYLWNYESGIYFGNNGVAVGRFIGTKFNVPGVYSGTTTGGGPVYVESDGDLLRYTSSLKYKTDVETIEDARADAILNCRPVWYRSKCENDIKTKGAEKSDWGWYGFIAEEVAEIEPRLVNWATKDSVEQEDKTTLSVERDPADYEAEGVRYDNFVPLMLNLIKRQKAQIETLERRLSDAGIA